MQFLHGGELIARQLAAQGVNAIYGLCGGHVAPIFNSCANNGLAVIDVRHEQAAGHAADAHAEPAQALDRPLGQHVAEPIDEGVDEALALVADLTIQRGVATGDRRFAKSKAHAAAQHLEQADHEGGRDHHQRQMLREPRNRSPLSRG